MLLLLFKLLQRFIIVSVLLSVFIHVVITKPINNSINNDRLSAPIPDQLDILFATPDDAELYSSLSNIDTTQNLQSDRNEPFTILNNENIQVTPSEFPHDSTLGELMPNQISYQNYEKVSSKELAVHKHYAYLAKETFCQRKANKIQSAQVFVSERQTKGLLILGFSGDEDYSPLPYRIMQSEPTEFPGISNSKVLKSLYKPYEEWAAANLDRIVESLKKLSGVSNIVLTGFGLGGAYAQFAAVSLNLKSTAQLKISVYAFGTPQVGNRPFVDALSSNINVIRYLNGNDPFPTLASRGKNSIYVSAGIAIWQNPANGVAYWCPNEEVCLIKKNFIIQDHFGPYIGINMKDCNQKEKSLESSLELPDNQFATLNDSLYPLNLSNNVNIENLNVKDLNLGDATDLLL